MKNSVKTNRPTVIWSANAEAEDFVKVPRVLTRLGRYDDRMGQQLRPRHLLLLLNLAGRQFQDRPIRTSWQALGQDLGVKRDTVRKWAYELRDFELLTIARPAASDQDRRNIFEIKKFVRLVSDAFERRAVERQHYIPQAMTDSFSNERD